MKYRPSSRFLRIVIPAGLVSAVLWSGILPELDDARAVPVRGEIVFQEKSQPSTGSGSYQIGSLVSRMGGLREWLDGSLEHLMHWEHNPWRRAGDRPYPGVHYQSLLASKDPKDRAKAREIQRLAEAWLDRLMERYPELAVQSRNVPDERNGFLKWLEFSERMKELAGADDSASLGLGQPLTDYLAGKAPWDPAAAREWLAANAALMAEVRVIAGLDEASSDGISVDRYHFIPARLAKDCADALMIEARLAAENGDVAAAMESVGSIRGLIHHLSDIESPTLLLGTVQILLQLQLEKRVFSDILPSLPPGSRDAAAWEALVNPQVRSPAEYARLMKGEWSVTLRQWVLPPILDSGEPLKIPDPGNLLDAYSLPFQEIARTHGDAPWSDVKPVLSDPESVAAGLSPTSQSMISILMIGAEAWKKGMLTAQHTHGLSQAAFAVLKGEPVPADPVWGKPYQWDPATRTLSLPDGPEFKEVSTKSIVLPAW